MYTKIMFHGQMICGYFIKRIAEDRFIFYMPAKHRTLPTLKDDAFMNLDKAHLQLSQLYITNYPITENQI